MFSFGTSSEHKLATVDSELVQVPRLVMTWGVYDFTIVWGWRSDEQQMDAFLSGNSKKKTGSYHQVTKNGKPNAQAFDFAPWCLLPAGYGVLTGEMGIPWKDTHAFAVLGGLMIAAGEQLKIPVVYGGDWDMDGLTTDQTLMDWGHCQKKYPRAST